MPSRTIEATSTRYRVVALASACGAHLVAGLTPAFIVGGGLLGPWPGLLRVMSWRGVFVTFGLVGVAWVATWLYWFRNDPSEHPSVSPSELALIVANRRPVADHGSGWTYWRTLVRSRKVIALSIRYVPNCMMFYFCITWLPSYLLQRHGFNISGIAYVLVGVSLLAAARAPSPVLAAVLTAVATGLTMFTLGAAWGTVLEIGDNHVASSAAR